MRAQRRVAAGPITPFEVAQILERRRQAVGAVLLRSTAKVPQRALQPGRERCKALAALDHAARPPARMRERKLIEPMCERDARDRDAQFAGVGEIRKALTTWRMFLSEKHFALSTVGSAPLPHPALKRAQSTWSVLAWIAALQLLEQRHGAQVRALPQQRKQFA